MGTAVVVLASVGVPLAAGAAPFVILVCGFLTTAALGLPLEATNEEITSTYRKLALEHHPDRFAHEGAQATERASARFRAVHEAYEELRQRRGF